MRTTVPCPYLRYTQTFMITDIISHPVGLYVLTDIGDLGFFDTSQRFQIDQDATSALQTRRLNLAALREHLAQGDTDQLRVGVVGRAGGIRDWGRTSLFFEDSVVRALYPISGSVSQNPTVFQRKNQEKSLYRGMELLLEYRRTQYPDAAVYCPVLFDCGTTLDRYPGIQACVTPENAAAPALDVLNLVAVVLPDGRDAAVLNGIKARLHAVLIHKERRRTQHFELLASPHNPHTPPRPIRDPYADTPGHKERAITLTEPDARQLRSAHRIALTERWQEVPQRPIDAATLRTFVHFHDVDTETLHLIATQAGLYTALPGTPLLAEGMTDPWNLYLQTGSVLLTPNDGVTVTVEGGTATAKSPIAFLKPRKYTVTALSAVSFWWIHDVILKAVGVNV